MNTTKNLGLAALLLVGIGLSLACRTQTTPAPSSSRELLERFLLRAPIVAVDKSLQLGRMSAWLVTLSDGKTIHQAFFKSVRRPRPALMPDSYTYELAAYELDKLLGLELIPVTVKRQIDGRSGSLQEFLEGVETEKSRRQKNLQPPDVGAYQDKLDEITLLENLTCTPRQDLGDILIDKNTWRVWRVDFSEAFMPATELLPERLIRRASRRFTDALRAWNEAQVKQRLAPYLNTAEMEALFKRRQLILDQIDRLIKEKGEAAVLFSP
jgi:hypothetical protein